MAPRLIYVGTSEKNLKKMTVDTQESVASVLKKAMTLLGLSGADWGLAIDVAVGNTMCVGDRSIGEYATDDALTFLLVNTHIGA